MTFRLFVASLRDAFTEDRVADAPVRVWRDWAIIAVGLVTALLELVLRTDLGWPVLSFVVCVLLLPTVLWRRSHPLAMMAITFAGVNVLSLAGWLAGTAELTGMWTAAFVLLHVYAVFRWGPGSHFVPAFVVMAAVIVASIPMDFDGVGELIGGTIVLLLPALFGALVRYQQSSEDRKVDEIRMREREQLARELHDTVAHHVSAIAVQAQAGRLVATSDPAVRALELIEEEASRTLTEMRLMVTALRDEDEADFAPQRGLADLHELVANGPGTPHVDIELVGALDALRPAVQAAIYRLTQESITNALRHARGATSVLVRIVGRGDNVELTVRDDGATIGAMRGTGGHGLTGMSERARLLGGSLDAGPSPSGGWLVSATLPVA